MLPVCLCVCVCVRAGLYKRRVMNGADGRWGEWLDIFEIEGGRLFTSIPGENLWMVVRVG